MTTLGFLVLFLGLFSAFRIGNFVFDFHVNFFASLLTITGFQLCMIGLFAKSFAYINGFDKHDRFIKILVKKFSLEVNLIIGLVIIGVGGFLFFKIFLSWILSGRGPLF